MAMSEMTVNHITHSTALLCFLTKHVACRAPNSTTTLGRSKVITASMQRTIAACTQNKWQLCNVASDKTSFLLASAIPVHLRCQLSARGEVSAAVDAGRS